jgi:hypothetical protein
LIPWVVVESVMVTPEVAGHINAGGIAGRRDEQEA